MQKQVLRELTNLLINMQVVQEIEQCIMSWMGKGGDVLICMHFLCTCVSIDYSNICVVIDILAS